MKTLERKSAARESGLGEQMHIAVEGTGGTEAARMLAETLGILFVERPLQYLLGGREKYMRLARKIDRQPSDNLRAWFYGLGHLYFSQYLAGQSVVTDQYFPWNWVLNSNEENLPLFDVLAEQIRPPDFTFLLTADPKKAPDWFTKSSLSDSLPPVAEHAAHMEQRYRQCLERYRYPYAVVDCTALPPQDTAKQMLEVLQAVGMAAAD